MLCEGKFPASVFDGCYVVHIPEGIMQKENFRLLIGAYTEAGYVLAQWTDDTVIGDEV